MNFQNLKEKILNQLENDLPNNLHYHNVNHTIGVMNAILEIGNKENLNEKEMCLTQTAGLFHDIGFLVQYLENEAIACDLAKKQLSEYDYTEKEIAQICKMIMATVLPQNPQDKLSKIICDADLYSLGSENFMDIAFNLKKEWGIYGKSFSNEEWLNFEINFLKTHTFFLKSADELYAEKKKKNIKKLQNKLKILNL